MSSRAIRALRGRNNDILLQQTVSDDDDEDADDDTDDDDADDDDDDDEINVARPNSTFLHAAAMLNDDDDDDDESSTSFSSNSHHEQQTKQVDDVKIDANDGDHEEDDDDEEEDFDKILDEFQNQDMMMMTNNDTSTMNVVGEDNNNQQSIIDCILISSLRYILYQYDTKDMDYDYSMKQLLLFDNTYKKNNNKKSKQQQQSNNSKATTTRNIYLFNTPRNGWTRPPHYIGGGMGMKLIDSHQQQQSSISSIPWPYNNVHILLQISNATTATTAPSHIVNNDDKNYELDNSKTMSSLIIRYNQWYEYIYSDYYLRDCYDYETIIQNSGDTNALLMFVIHHPFCCSAILQLSTLLLQTNNKTEAISFICRCLYIYESSMLLSFKQHKLYGTTTTTTPTVTTTGANDTTANNINQQQNYFGTNGFMNYETKENIIFFQTLQKFIQVSYIAGLNQTAFATCRFILSLDPLRDPMNILLIIDRFVLASCCSYSGHQEQLYDNNDDDNDNSNNTVIDMMKWLIHVVDDNIIPILYCPNVNEKSSLYHHGTILDLPNWSYSYALILFRLHSMSQYEDDQLNEKANVALRNAIKRYPLLLNQILIQLNIDTNGRSFRRDWYTILQYTKYWSNCLDKEWSIQLDNENNIDNTILLSATIQTFEKITKNYILCCSQYWNNEVTLQWLYDNLYELYHEYQISRISSGENVNSSTASSMMIIPKPPSPAMIRYIKCDLSVYDNNIITLPPDIAVAMIDGGLLAHAMNIETNRPRFIRQLQNQHRRRGGGGGRNDNDNRIDNNDELLFDDENNGLMPHRRPGGGYVLGGPPTEHINLDWPIMEIFLRSFLPWTHIDGIIPPPRPP